MSSSQPPKQGSQGSGGAASAPTLSIDETAASSPDLRRDLGMAHTVSTNDGSVGPSIPPLGSAVSQPVFAVAPGMLEFVPGTMVGEYRLEGKLGEGGMGQVFAATHPIIGKRAAIKVIKLELCANPEAVERFVQEARAVNQIGHQNIVDVFAFGNLPDGRRYLVMEWLKGESLGARLKREKLSVPEVCDILDPICRALEAAHEKRIIHRDLKPDNVFLVSQKGDKPMVKLLDFGIAKLVGTDDTRLERTRTGSMLGTPQYISPEQARGRGVDERTDIYALGVMAFEMFCGRPPFVADNAMDMISSHLHDPPPPPGSISAELPALLDTLLLSMLSKDPGGRPSLPRVRETLAEVRRAPSSMRATVRAEPPQVMVKSPPAARGATLQMPPSAPLATPTAEVATTARTRPNQARWLMWGGIGIGLAVAAALATGVLQGKPEPVAKKAPPVEPAPAPAPVVEPPKPAPEPPAVVAPPAALPAKLTVKVNVPDATVEIAGKTATGATVQLELPAGPAELKVSAPGRKPFSKAVDLVAGQPLEVKVRLERGKGPTPRPVPPPPTDKPPPKPPVDDDDSLKPW